MKKTLLALGMMAVLMMTENSQAELILSDRGNGLVYDSRNNISWTQDASVSGLGTFPGQAGWAQNFSLAGFDDFRLASITELASLYELLSRVVGSDTTGNTTPFVNIFCDYWSDLPPFDRLCDFSFFDGSQFNADERLPL